ncbi:MAG: hypothetical protein AB1391_00720 [Candidatus Micrarchaeota archaeon]
MVGHEKKVEKITPPKIQRKKEIAKKLASSLLVASLISPLSGPALYNTQTKNPLDNNKKPGIEQVLPQNQKTNTTPVDKILGMFKIPLACAKELQTIPFSELENAEKEMKLNPNIQRFNYDPKATRGQQVDFKKTNGWFLNLPSRIVCPMLYYVPKGWAHVNFGYNVFPTYGKDNLKCEFYAFKLGPIWYTVAVSPEMIEIFQPNYKEKKIEGTIIYLDGRTCEDGTRDPYLPIKKLPKVIITDINNSKYIIVCDEQDYELAKRDCNSSMQFVLIIVSQSKNSEYALPIIGSNTCLAKLTK